VKYPPTAPSRTASDSLAAESVSSGNGTPVASNAAPPISLSRKSYLIPALTTQQ